MILLYINWKIIAFFFAFIILLMGLSFLYFLKNEQSYNE